MSGIPCRVWFESATYDVTTLDDLLALPAFGLIRILERLDVYPFYAHVKYHDFYLYRADGWWGVDWVGLIDNLAVRCPEITRVFFGRTVANETWRRAKAEAEALAKEWLEDGRRQS